MAFPVFLEQKDFTLQQLQDFRNRLLNKLYQKKLPDTDNQVAQQLAEIAQFLGQQANNEPTAYEEGIARTGATSNTNLLVRQVERALTQVLGRSPGRGSDGFMSALNTAFPSATDGKIVTVPSRSVVSMYAPTSGNGNNSTDLIGQLSVEQANLYRQASLITADALQVLEGIAPFDPTADQDAVEALRALVRSQMTSLVEEFGRLDEPRRSRVDIYFSTLKRNLVEFGKLAKLASLSQPGTSSLTRTGLVDNLVTTKDEAQVAAFELIQNYVDTLNGFWTKYLGASVSEQESGSYSDKLSRSSVLLPVIADSNASFMAAMDSIGFSESERRTESARFSTLSDFPDQSLFLGLGQDLSLQFVLPRITVNDLTDWIDRFSSIEAPDILATSGRYGLEFVADQADTLFWVIGLILDYIQFGIPADVREGSQLERNPLLKQLLSYERVNQTLRELLSQLKVLADLSPGLSNSFK